MKILVFSDSHGMFGNMKRAAMLHSDAEVIIHLGDGASDTEQLKKECPDVVFFQVKGNCDFFSLNADTKKLGYVNTFELNGFKFFICHGHTLNVKSTLDPLIDASCRSDADVAIFGHTHNMYERYIPSEELPDRRENGLYLFNPGSISYPNYGYKASYGIIELKQPYILLSHGTID